MAIPIMQIWDEVQGKYVPVPTIQGPPGAKGDKGDPGTTPVKGTDYWTAADQAEIVQAVLAELPDGTEVSY